MILTLDEIKKNKKIRNNKVSLYKIPTLDEVRKSNSTKSSVKTILPKANYYDSKKIKANEFTAPNILEQTKNAKNMAEVYNFAMKNGYTTDELSDAFNLSATTAMNLKPKVLDLAKQNGVVTTPLVGLSDLKPTIGEVSRKKVTERAGLNSSKYFPDTKVGDYTTNKNALLVAKEDNERQKQLFDNSLATTEEYQKYKENALQSIPLLRYAKDYKKVEQEGVNKFQKFISPFVSGVNKSLSGSKSGKYELENGAQVHLDDISTIKSQKALQDDDSWIYKMYSGATQSMGGMTAGMLANAIAPGAGLPVFFATTKENAYNNALLQGYDKNNAEVYSTINAIMETGLQYALGGIEKLGSKSKYSKLLEKLTKKIIKNPVLRETLSNMGSEGTEEFIQEWLDPKIQTYVLENKSAKESWNASKFFATENFEAFLLGAFNAGLLNMPQTIESASMQNHIKKQLDNGISAEDIVQNLVGQGLTEENAKEAIEYANSKINNNLTSKELKSKLVNLENKKAITTNVKTQQSLETQIQDLKNQISELQGQLPEADIRTIKTSKIPLSGIKNGTFRTQINQNSINANQQVEMPQNGTEINSNNTLNQGLDNSSFNLKQKQNEIIQNSNPAGNDVSAWIRNVDDIKTFEETLQDGDYKEYFDAGKNFDETYTADMAKKALETGEITVYSSYPIEQGVFVSPSKMEAQSYSGTGKIYSKQINLTDVAWIDPTQGQYAKVNNNLLKINVKQTKGNIPINEKLLSKYNNITDLMNSEINNYDGKINVKNNIPELNNKDFTTINRTESYHLAKKIFNDYNDNNIFNNNGNQIIVSNTDIKESINKIFNNVNQRKLLKEHFQVFSDLGDIIEKSTLVSQTQEAKNRKNNNVWSYYLNGLKINNNNYLLEFDVVSTGNGENHYRVQRLQKKTDISAGSIANSNTAPTLETSVIDNNIPQSNNKVKLLPTATNNYSMQNQENNVKVLPKAKKTMNPNEISQLKEINANTTPGIKNIKVSSGDGKSSFYDNVTTKTKALSEESRQIIKDNLDVEYYKEVTNVDSLTKAYDKLNNDGESEALRWFSNDSFKATNIDVAEGWILLKQYEDSKNYDGMVQVAKKMREIGTKAGQTVQMFNLLERLSPEGMVKYAQSELSEAYDHMVKNKSQEWINKHKSDFDLSPSEVQYIVDTMNEISKMKDGYDKKVKLAEIQKLMIDKLPPERGAGMKAWMRISMLFNPKTQVRNVLGNAVILPVNTVSDFFSSAVDKAISKKTGVRTTGNMNIKGYAKGFKQGLFQSYNDFKKGINTRNIEGNRFEISEGKSFTNKNLVGKSLNKVDNLLSFMLDAGDRGFYEASFINSINNQMILNNTDSVTADMIDIATSEALQRTWQDNNDYTRFVLNIRKGLNNINVKGYGLGDTLIPFAKTPANLTKAIIDYSPAGLIKTINEGINLKKSLSNGQYTSQMQHRFVQDLGKATAGTLLYIIGYALAKAGIISGKSDDDKDVSNFMKNTLGVNSYSIKIGNKSFTYDWAQPVAAPLSIMSNIVQKQKENTGLFENILSSLDTAGNILLEQSFLDSINTVLSNKDGIGTGLQEALFELPSRAIPTFSKQLTDLIDGTTRQSFVYGKPLETAINKAKAKMPGLSKTLAPSVDTLGRDIQKYGGKNNIFNVFLNPANVSIENTSDSAKEIYRLYKETGDATLMPRVSPYYINSKGVKTLLTNKERTDFQRISGQIIEENVSKLINNVDYKDLSDEDKTTVINDIINYSYNKARKDVLNMDMSKEYNKVQEWTSDGGKVYEYYVKRKENNYMLESLERHSAITSFGVKYDDYKEYQKEIAELKEAYKGTKNTDLRKQKVFQYINSLPYNKTQKLALYRLLGGYSISGNKNEMYKYINGLKLTKQEKKDIWNVFYKERS